MGSGHVAGEAIRPGPGVAEGALATGEGGGRQREYRRWVHAVEGPVGQGNDRLTLYHQYVASGGGRAAVYRHRHGVGSRVGGRYVGQVEGITVVGECRTVFGPGVAHAIASVGRNTDADVVARAHGAGAVEARLSRGIFDADDRRDEGRFTTASIGDLYGVSTGISAGHIRNDRGHVRAGEAVGAGPVVGVGCGTRSDIRRQGEVGAAVHAAEDLIGHGVNGGFAHAEGEAGGRARTAIDGDDHLVGTGIGDGGGVDDELTGVIAQTHKTRCVAGIVELPIVGYIGYAVVLDGQFYALARAVG